MYRGSMCCSGSGVENLMLDIIVLQEWKSSDSLLSHFVLH
jgi:hypothetical protein